MWILYAFLSALTAALVAIFAKLGLREVDPTLATTLRSDRDFRFCRAEPGPFL